MITENKNIIEQFVQEEHGDIYNKFIDLIEISPRKIMLKYYYKNSIMITFKIVDMDEYLNWIQNRRNNIINNLIYEF